MDGIGRSLREEAEVTFWRHCREVVEDVSRVGDWICWNVLSDAGKEVVGVIFALCYLALFPITIPLSGYVRMKMARKRFQQELDRQERVNRLRSRVQKVQPTE